MTHPSIDEIPADAAMQKLSRVLGVEPEHLGFLGELDVEVLRELRDVVSDTLQRADHHRLVKVVAASKLLPLTIAASIGEHWFGATLCARLVGLIDPERGGQFSRHLSLDFMADITQQTDPRVVGDLVHHLPLTTMQSIASTLIDRDDHLTLSHFVGHLPPDVVADIMKAIEDDAIVVRVAIFVEDLTHLDPVVALLSDERLLALVDAVRDEDLWVEGLHLFGHLSETQISRVASMLIDGGEGRMQAALEGFEKHDLWHQGLAILSQLEGDEVGELATTLIDLDRGLLHAAIEAFHRNDLWVDALEVLAELEGDKVQRVAALLVELPAEVIDAGVAAASQHDIWEPLVRAGVAARELPSEVRRRLAEIIDGQSAELVEQFNHAARRLGHDGLLESLLTVA